MCVCVCVCLCVCMCICTRACVSCMFVCMNTRVCAYCEYMRFEPLLQTFMDDMCPQCGKCYGNIGNSPSLSAIGKSWHTVCFTCVGKNFISYIHACTLARAQLPCTCRCFHYALTIWQELAHSVLHLWKNFITYIRAHSYALQPHAVLLDNTSYTQATTFLLALQTHPLC